MRRKTQTKLGKGLRSLRSFSPGIISILGLVGLVWMVAMAPVISEWKPDNASAADEPSAQGMYYPFTITIDGIAFKVTWDNEITNSDASSNGFPAKFYYYGSSNSKYTLSGSSGATEEVAAKYFSGQKFTCSQLSYFNDCIKLDFASALELSLSSDTLNLSSTNADVNGFTSDSVIASVASSASAGYNLYMSASEKDEDGNYTTSLINTSDKQYTINTLESDVSLLFTTANKVRTYDNTGNFTANRWAYSVADITGKTEYEISSLSGTSIFKAIPLDETIINVASNDSTTSSTAINTLAGETAGGAASSRVSNIFSKNGPSGTSRDGSDDSIEITLAARTDNATPAGNYANTIVFTLIGNITAEPGTIVYDPNGETGGGTSIGVDGTTTVGGDMSMVTHTDVSSGSYVMLNAPNYWRNGYGFAGWSEDKDAATKLANGQNVTVYGPNEMITAPSTVASKGMRLYATWIKSTGNMQSWNGCSSMSVGAITALTDTRDNNTYAIAKLADNKCWVVENYRLASGVVNSTNTNNPISGFVWTESSNSWCSDESSACIDKVLLNTNNINPSLTASPNTDNDSSSWYSYGVIYNWYTATAGRGTYPMASGNTTGDICPLGWHLPTSTDSGEFQAMYAATGSNWANLRKYPNNFVLAGFRAYNSMEFRGDFGSYWSSTAHTNKYAYHLYYGDTSVYDEKFGYIFTEPSADGAKSVGNSIRCVSDTTTIDGVEYIRLADGNYWTKESYGSATWDVAATLCPSGTHLPSADEFDKLLTAYGGTQNSDYGSPYGWYDGDADLQSTTGWSGDYWSSTENASSTSRAWSLYVRSSDSRVYDLRKSNSINVVCAKS